MPLTTQEVQEALSTAGVDVSDLTLKLRHGQVRVESEYSRLVEVQQTLTATYSVEWGPSADEPYLYVRGRRS